VIVVAPKACKIDAASAILLALSRYAFCEPISDAVGGDRRALWSRKRTVRTFLAGLCLALLVQVAAYAGSDPVEAFYRGKVLTLFVGYGPGGGYDLTARVLARHLGSHIPGSPNIVVQNMPGAGSLVAANYLYNVAPRDGTQFGLIARNMPLLGLLGHNPNVRFDPRKFTWIGSASDFSDDAYVLIVRKDAPVKSIEDARRPDGPVLVLGGTAEGASSADVPKILRDALGLHIKQILGYRDSAAIFLAMENSELSGRMCELSSVRATHPQWLKPDSDYRILVIYGRAKRDPEFPDVPTARELAPDKAARDLIEFTETPLLSMAWPFVAPPGLPQERATALQSAFAITAQDPDYLADAAALKIAVSPVNAADIYRAIDKLSAASPEILDYVRNLMNAGKGG
jgi:tripartite-type tricarboxylate transporter receptor subunit TctC